MKKLFNFLKENNHLYISDIITQFIINEHYRKNHPKIYRASDLKELEKETGLSALDLDNLVKYHKFLDEKGLLPKIVGRGNNVDEQIEKEAEYVYITNTYNFKVFINENTPKEQLDNAIWDPSYDPMVGIKPAGY